MLTKLEKEKLVVRFGGSNKNSGKTEVQVAILTAEIEALKPHFETNKKDRHSKRGFIAKIEKRKALLKYLRNNYFERYQTLIKELGLRK